MPQWLAYQQQYLASHAGKDATEDFEEIGHSNAAKDLLSKYIVGDFEVCRYKFLSSSTHSTAGAHHGATAISSG